MSVQGSLNINSDFFNALGQRESSGNYQAENNYGYIGKYQFGGPALEDAGFYNGGSDWSGTWTGKDGVNSLSQFLNNSVAQDDAAQIYANILWGYIVHDGLDQYVGENIDGIQITQSGLIAGAWLVGVGNLSKFLNSNGETVPVDGNGTPITEYLQTFSQYTSTELLNTHANPGLVLQLSSELGNAQNQIIDPLVISMNGQAVTTTSLANGSYVDYRNTGFEEQSSWFSSNAGILVDVTNPSGTLNNGFTILGTGTTNQNGNVQGQSGFTQLASMDTNHDGVINASDTDFNQIEIWVGSNGQAGSGQLETLAQAGITSISLNTSSVNTTDANGDKLVATSTVTYSNGTTGTLSDMNMAVNTSNTIDESAGMTNSAYANLPNVAGWGDVHDLQVAMALDTTGNLANLVKQYLAATPAQQPTLINNLIFTWTGVENDPQETTYHFTGDTREIDALSKFVGAQYSNNSGWSTTLVTMAGVPMIEQAWNDLVNYVSGCLLSNGLNQSLLTDVSLSYNQTTQSFNYDVSGLVTALSKLSTSQQLEFGTFLSGSSSYNGIVAALNAYYPNPTTTFQNEISVLGTMNQSANITVSDTTQNISSGFEFNVSGGYDTLNFAMLGALVNAYGNDNTLNLNNGAVTDVASNPLTINGNNNTISASNVTNMNLTANGNTDTINVTGSMANLTVNGSGSTITASGVGSLNLSGNATLTGSNDTVNAGSGVTLTLASGNGNTITESQTQKTANVTLASASQSETFGGSWGTFDTTAQATGDALTLSGNYDTLLQMSGSAAFSSVAVTGAYDTLNLLGTGGVTVNVSGTGNTLDLTSDTVNASNVSNLTLNGNNNTLNGSGLSNLTANGNTDTISVTGSMANLTVNGNSTTIDAAGSITNLTVNGNSTTVDATGSTTNLTVNGSGSTITASGIGSLNLSGNATLTGSNDTVNVGSGVTLTLASGNGNIINEWVSHTGSVVLTSAAQNETFGGYFGTIDVSAEAAGDELTLWGYDNALTQTGGDAFGGVSVIGSSDTLRLSNTGEAVAVSGGFNTLNLTGDTVTANNAYGLTVNGNNNTIDATNTNDEYVTVNGSSTTINNPGVTSTLTVNGNDNTIVANGVASVINLSGNTTLTGSNDTVNVGAGVTLTLGSGSGANVINTTSATTDVLSFGTGILNDQLWFSRSGNNLVVQVDGTGEAETISNWFAGAQFQLSDITVGGNSASAANVNALVQAMASMTPPPLGQTTLTAAQSTQLAPVLAANWH